MGSPSRSSRPASAVALGSGYLLAGALAYPGRSAKATQAAIRRQATRPGKLEPYPVGYAHIMLAVGTRLSGRDRCGGRGQAGSCSCSCPRPLTKEDI
jgi:hypothetical protein